MNDFNASINSSMVNNEQQTIKQSNIIRQSGTIAKLKLKPSASSGQNTVSHAVGKVGGARSTQQRCGTFLKIYAKQKTHNT